VSLSEDWMMARRIIHWDNLGAKRLRKKSNLRLIVTIFIGLAGIMGICAISVSSLLALHHAAEQEQAGFIILAALLSSVFLLYIQIMTAYNRIFMLDTDLLLLSPITARAIMIAKLYGNVRSAILISILGLPMVIVFGAISIAPFWFYPVAVLTLLLSGLFISITALFLMMLLLLVLPRKLSRDTLAVVSTLVAVAIFIGPRFLLQNHTELLTSSGLEMWTQSLWDFLPFAWAGHVLVAASQSSMRFLYYLALLCLITMLFSWLSMRIADVSLRERLTSMTERSIGRNKSKMKSSTATPAHKTVLGKYSIIRYNRRTNPTLSLLRKDLLRLRRTPNDFITYLFPTVYLLFLVLQKSSHSHLIWGLSPILILILASTMGHLPISCFGIETQQIWLLLLSPLSPRALLRAKWLYGSLPTLIWWELLCGAIAWLSHESFQSYSILAVSGVWMVAGAVWLTMPFAARGAAFRVRQVGRRNLYVNRNASWYLAAIIPYLLLQLVCVGYTIFPVVDIPGGMKSWLIGTPTEQVVIGMALSLAVALIACLIGRSMALEAWQHRVVMLLQEPSLST